MCLLFVYIDNDPGEDGYRLILASNRDEFWERPTDLVDFRDNNKWVGGADLEPGREGGSWLGISTNGKVAVLLNILSPQKPDGKGRGSLVRDFLKEDKTEEEYSQEVFESASLYNPFHLITFDLRNDCDVNCVTFCDETQTKKFPKGYHGADNGKDIQKPWKKREEGEVMFSHLVESLGTVDKKEKLIDGIIDLLNDKTQHFPDERLKEQFRETGRPDHGSLILSRSSMFVFSPEWGYGTRTNSVILVDKGGNCDFVERTLQTPVDTNNLQWETKKLKFKITLQQSSL